LLVLHGDTLYYFFHSELRYAETQRPKSARPGFQSRICFEMIFIRKYARDV